MKVLIVEDSPRLRRSLVEGLSRLGLSVEATGDGKEGLCLAKSTPFDVIVLDIMLPGIDGITFLKQFREKRTDTRVLILSAKDEIEDRVKGLNLGADDYLVKPFAFDELHARILSLYRRAYSQNTSQLNIENLVVDTASKQVLCDDVPLPLTPHEYSILEKLASSQGRVVTYGQLEDYLYSSKFVSRNSLEAHVSSLRKKLKAVNLSHILQTRRGFGYLIQ